jgi:hypothetical protein
MPQGTGGMGTGTDVRIYNPRSESSHMYRNNHEEDTYGYESAKVRDEKMDKKIRQQEKTKEKMDKIKHIKVKPSDIQQFVEQEDEETDDSDKFDTDRELSAQTGPVGNLGALTSLAAQARGPGFAGGQAFAMSEPMNVGVVDRILKREKKSSKERKREKRRKSEERKKWRPSTGKFDYGPGGTLGPKGATTRRHKARMRSVKRGKLTGMMDAPKAVEMEHRGVAVKQPKSKDPAPYKEFLGQQESRRRMGNVRSPTSSQLRYGARHYYGGKTGGGRLQGMGDLKVKRPRLHPVRMPKIQPSAGLAAPHLVKPQLSGAGGMGGMPSASPPMAIGTDEPSMVMTGKVGVGSKLKKARFGYYEITELRQLINQAKRALARKEKKRKSMGTGDTGGASTTHSRGKQTPTGQTTKPEGGTENADMQNIGGVVGVKGGRTA